MLVQSALGHHVWPTDHVVAADAPSVQLGVNSCRAGASPTHGGICEGVDGRKDGQLCDFLWLLSRNSHETSIIEHNLNYGNLT